MRLEHNAFHALDLLVLALRVYPGGLAVARSIGTLKCKMSQYGAINGCVISTPELRIARRKIYAT